MDRARVDAMRATLAALTTERGDEGRMYWRCVRNHFSRPGTTPTDTGATNDGGVVTRRVRREEMDAVAQAVFGRDTEGYRTHLAFTAALRATLVAGALASAKAKERRTAEAAAAAAAAAAAMMEGEEGVGTMFRRPIAAAAAAAVDVPGVVVKSQGGSVASVSVSRKKQTPTAMTTMTTANNMSTSKPRQSDRLGSTTSSGVPLGIETSDIPSLKLVPRLRARCRMMTQTPMRVRADAAQCVRRAAAERVKRAIRAAVDSRELTRSLDNSRWTSAVKLPITLEDLIDSVDVLQKLETVSKIPPRALLGAGHSAPTH